MRTNKRVHSRSRRVGATAVAAVAVLAMSACTGGDSSGSGTGEGGGEAPTTLSIAIQRQPQGFDHINLANGNDAFIWASIYDRLLVQGDDGLPAPGAAESWEYSEDGLTLTLQLRDGMTFSNGDPVVAGDVKASLDGLVSTPGPLQPDVANIASVDAPDDSTVVINLSAPDPSLLSNLAMGAGAIADDATLDAEDAATNPVGSGAYTLDTSATVAGSTYVLHRRDDYWDVDAYPFETVTVKVIADTTAIDNALRSGEINVGNIGPGSAPSMEAAGITVNTVEGMSQMTLKILDRDGTIVPALAELKVRQAINMALDREGIVAGPLSGQGQPTEQVAFPGSGAFDEELNGTYPFDVEKAKALMAEAGYPDGFSIELPSTIYSQTLDPLVQQALGDIGITVTYASVPAQDTGSAIISKKFAMAVWPDGAAPPARVMLNHYAEDGFLNPFHNTDPELTGLIDQLRATVDPADQGPIAADINRWSVENAWDAPIVSASQEVGTQEGYTYLATSQRTFSSITLFGVAD